MKKLFILLLILFIFSCKSEETEEREEESFPDFSLTNAEYITSDSEREPVKIIAGSMEFYLGNDKLILADAEFFQNKKDSEEIALYGKAGYISLNTKTQDSEMSGGVEIVMLSDDGRENRITADDLIWEKTSGKMETKGHIYLLYEDSSMEGIGFSGNMNDAEFSFAQIISGELKQKVQDKEEEETEETEAGGIGDDTNESNMADDGETVVEDGMAEDEPVTDSKDI